MATLLQFEAKQKHARRSTGPKTGSGKAVSARNALRHGLASGMLIAPWECREDYDALLETMELLSNPTAMKTLRAAKAGKLAYKELNLADENFGL
mgnify:CR=1 FL=1